MTILIFREQVFKPLYIIDIFKMFKNIVPRIYEIILDITIYIFIIIVSCLFV
jgi:hypothetical protein